jgi:hypothetical protein
MGGSGVEEWRQLMVASIDEIESRTDNFAAFLAPGQQHCILPYDTLHRMA